MRTLSDFSLSAVGCLTDGECEGKEGLWVTFRSALQPLLTFTLSGAYVDIYNMFGSAFMR